MDRGIVHRLHVVRLSKRRDNPGTESAAFAFYAPAVLVDSALLGSTQARKSL